MAVILLQHLVILLTTLTRQIDATSTFNLKRFNSDTNPTCSSLLSLSYPDNSSLTMAFSAPTEVNTILAVKNSNELILVKGGKEISLNKFNSPIAQLQPHWYFQKAFLLTQTVNESVTTATAYEISLVSHQITSLVSFKLVNHLPISMLADPLQATLTLAFNNQFLVINTAYIGSNDSASHLYHETALCWQFNTLNFLISSSQIDGYAKIQTYYISTDANDLIECFIFKNECDCIPITNQTVLAAVKLFKTHGDSNNICQATVNDIQVNPGVYLSPHIHTPALRSCLRICSLPLWKTSLYNGINTGPHSWNKLPLEPDLSLVECTNSLQISDSIEAFGYTRTARDSSGSSFLLEVNYREALMAALVSPGCAHLETGYKYTVKYRQLTTDGLASLNFLSADLEYVARSSLETSITLELNSSFVHEVVVQIQTPFDQEAYTIGSYVVHTGVQTNLVEPEFKKIVLKTVPFILDDYWSQVVSDRSVIVSLLVSSDSLAKEAVDELANAQFLLSNLRTNECEVRMARPMRMEYFQVDPRFYRVSFVVGDLVEDNLYRFRVLNNNKPVGEVATLSNLVN